MAIHKTLTKIAIFTQLTTLITSTSCPANKCLQINCTNHNLTLTCPVHEREKILCECCPRCKKSVNELCGGDYDSYGTCLTGLKCVDLVDEEGSKLYKGRCKTLDFRHKSIEEKQVIDRSFDVNLCYDRPRNENPCINLSCLNGEWHQGITMCPIEERSCAFGESYVRPPTKCCGTCLPSENAQDLNESGNSISDDINKNRSKYFHDLNGFSKFDGLNIDQILKNNNKNGDKLGPNFTVILQPNTHNETFYKTVIVIAVTGFAIFIISIPFVVCLYRRQRVVHHQTYNFGGGYGENVAIGGTRPVGMNMQTRSPRVRRTTGPPKFVNSKSMFRGDTPPNYSSVANSPSLESVSQSESRKVSNSRTNHIMATVPAPKYSTASMREHLLQKLASRDIPIAGYTHCSGNEVALESDFGSTIDTRVSEAKF